MTRVVVLISLVSCAAMSDLRLLPSSTEPVKLKYWRAAVAVALQQVHTQHQPRVLRNLPMGVAIVCGA
jgi:hypothetical protein